jgi:hypothetical protein
VIGSLYAGKKNKTENKNKKKMVRRKFVNCEFTEDFKKKSQILKRKINIENKKKKHKGNFLCQFISQKDI